MEHDVFSADSRFYGLYARGFILGRYSNRDKMRAAVPRCWVEVPIGSNDKNFVLYADWRNTVCNETDGKRFVCILGKCLDLRMSTMNLSSIAKSLLLLVESKSAFLDYVDELCGRYLVIWGNGCDTWVLQDACGMRTCVYSAEYVASHYGLIAEIVHAPFITYWQTYQQLKKRPYCLPGRLTPYVGILNLLPNHSLNLVSSQVERVYPRCKRHPASVSEVIDYFSEMLKLQARILVENGHRLCVSMTAGNDSRVTFAALQEVKNDVELFTYSKPNSQCFDLDVEVACEIATACGIKWRHICLMNSPNKELRDLYLKNHYHIHSIDVIRAYLEEFPNEAYLHVRSNLFEIVRGRGAYNFANGDYRQLRDYSFPAPPDIAVDEEYRAFYDEENYASVSEYGYRQDDFLYWEYRMALWNAGGCLLGTDMAFDTWCFFNQRKFLDLALRMPEVYKTNNYLVYATVEKLWPAILYHIPNVARTTVAEFSWLSALNAQYMLSARLIGGGYQRQGGSFVEFGFEKDDVQQGADVCAELRFANKGNGFAVSFSIAFFCSRYADAKAYRMEIAANETEAVSLLNCGNAFSRNVAVDILIPSGRSEAVVTIRLKKIAAGLTRGGIVRICGLITRPVCFCEQSVRIRM